MVTITNGKLTLSVTPGAFKDVYAAQGFKEISNPLHSTQKHVHTDAEASGGIISRPEPENVSGDRSESSTDIPAVKEQKQLSRQEELSEIPLNEMSPSQLREYAELLGVDIKGLKNKSAVKNKIRSVL